METLPEILEILAAFKGKDKTLKFSHCGSDQHGAYGLITIQRDGGTVTRPWYQPKNSDEYFIIRDGYRCIPNGGSEGDRAPIGAKRETIGGMLIRSGFDPCGDDRRAEEQRRKNIDRILGPVAEEMFPKFLWFLGVCGLVFFFVKSTGIMVDLFAKVFWGIIVIGFGGMFFSLLRGDRGRRRERFLPEMDERME